MVSLLNTRSVLIVVGLLLAGGALYYVHALQQKLDRQTVQLQTAEQREAAYKDSLRDLGSALGGDLQLYGRYDMPVQLDPPDYIPGRVGTQTTTQITPEAADTTGDAQANTETENGYRYNIDWKVGRYTVRGTLDVLRPGNALNYDLSVQGDPFELGIYRTESGGLKETVVSVPSRIRVTGLQTRYEAPVADPRKRWRLRAPVVALRPEQPDFIAYGAEVHYHTPSLWGARVFAEAGALATTDHHIMPTFRIGASF